MSSFTVNRYIARLTLSLDHAIAISMKRNPHSPSAKFVRAILLVKGVHFYGFHSSYSPFLKIVIIDPAFVTRAVTVLQFGNVMRTCFNVYESHLSYLLQFMCDFGLYGCGSIDLGEVWQRSQEDEEAGQDFDQNENRKTFQNFNHSPHFRQTRMPLEVDAAAHQILNRHKLLARHLHHKLSIPAPPLPPEPLVISVRELWEDERRRRLARGLSPSPEIPVDPSISSRGKGGEWISEARWWDEVRKRIEMERQGDIEIVTGSNGWENEVMTTFESVQALWEKDRKRRQYRPGIPSQTLIHQQDDGGDVSEGEGEYHGTWNQPDGKAQGIDVDVDEVMLSSQEMSRMVEIEEEEWAQLIGESNAYENENWYGEGDEGYIDGEEDFIPPEDNPPPDLHVENDIIHPSDSEMRKLVPCFMLLTH
jgi:DNA polymerase zeta